MTTCALCLNDKKLVESHIFPEFLYKPLYDSEHKYLVVSSSPTIPIRKRPKGIYERLLCAECDNIIIGTYEDYVAKVLFGDGSKEIEIETKRIGFFVNDLDYNKFKLFQLSLLWRASITDRLELPRINLGPHADSIRKMLYEGSPGKLYEYGCAMFFLPNQPEEMVGFIYSPEPVPSKVQGHRWYRAIFAGLFWTWIVSSHMNTYHSPEIFISEEGVLPVINSGIKGWRFIQRLASDLTKGGESV